MKIKKLSLTNFQGVQSAVIEFAQKTRIEGCNGCGKTTIANAIMWLLTGCPAAEIKNYTPKTTGAHRLEHSAEAVIEAGGELLTIKKVFREVYKTHRGSPQEVLAGHTTECFINDIPLKADEYASEISSLLNGIDTETIQAAMLPTFFGDILLWQKRRELLLEMCPDANPLEMPDFQELKHILDGKTAQQFLAVCKEKSKRIKKELAEIPPKIAENNLRIGKVTETDVQAANEFLKSTNATASQHDSLLHYTQEHEKEIRRKIVELDMKLEKLDLQRFEIVNSSYGGETTCPACGQDIPQEQLEKARQQFEAHKAARLAEINAKIEQHTAAYLAMKKELAETQAEIDKLSASRIEPCLEDILKAQSTIAEYHQSQAAKRRIDELKRREKELAAEYEIMQGNIFMCEECIRTRTEMVTEQINSFFKTVKFRLFTEQINGEIKDCCDVLIPCGDTFVPYQHANTAARINAGIEIACAIQTLMHIELPIIVDNAESVLDLTDTCGRQLIGLYVQDTPLDVAYS